MLHLEIGADASLHNREELLGAFGSNSGLGVWSSDEDLILAAYEKWGEACGSFLVGEFAFAIWDKRHHRLFCCRDQVGSRSFFYWRHGSRLVFGTDIRDILAVPGVPRELNHRKFGGLATLGGYLYYDEDTFHAGIQSLPWGSSLIAEKNGLRQQAYWRPEIQPQLVPGNPMEAYEKLRELLFSAVECRIKGHSSVGVYLSGGLDSGAVTAIAAQCLQRQGRELFAFAGVVPDDLRQQFPDERDFADVFNCFANVRINHVTTPGAGPFDNIHDPTRFVVSPRWNRALYLHEALETAAVHSGADVILQGTLGELGPTCWGNTYYAELAVRGKWLTLRRELRLLQEVEGIRPWPFMARRFWELLPISRGWPPLVLLSPDYPTSGRLLELEKCPWPDQRVNQAAFIRNCMRVHAFSGLGAWTPRHQIRMSQPLMDKRVIDFCLSAPPELKVRNGYRRNLIRGALDGILPERVQRRTSKTMFSPDYFLRYNQQLGKVRDFVSEIGIGDPIRSIIDIKRLERLLEPVEMQNVDNPVLGVVPATIYAICFLRQFEDYRR